MSHPCWKSSTWSQVNAKTSIVFVLLGLCCLLKTTLAPPQARWSSQCTRTIRRSFKGRLWGIQLYSASILQSVKLFLTCLHSLREYGMDTWIWLTWWSTESNLKRRITNKFIQPYTAQFLRWENFESRRWMNCLTWALSSQLNMEWASSIVFILRGEGTLHFFVVYCKLDAVIIWYLHPVPRTEESINLLDEATKLSTLNTQNWNFPVNIAEGKLRKNILYFFNSMFHYSHKHFGF